MAGDRATLGRVEWPGGGRGRDLPSPRHQRERSPAQVLARAGGVALGLRDQSGSNVLRQLVVGVVLEPPAQGELLGRLVSVPAVLVGQDHLDDVVAEAPERREKFRKQEKIGD